MVLYDFIGAEVIQAEATELDKLKKLIKLSLIPQCQTKFNVIDGPKDIHLELRCLPPIEIFVLLPENYPSNGAPLFMMGKTNSSNTLFYEKMRNFLYERLSEKWQEDQIMLYECVYYIQEEFMNAFLDSDIFAHNDQFKMNSRG